MSYKIAEALGKEIDRFRFELNYFTLKSTNHHYGSFSRAFL